MIQQLRLKKKPAGMLKVLKTGAENVGVIDSTSLLASNLL
jgi:hypothetical protein